MPKFFLRFIALLLVPCMIADPVLANVGWVNSDVGFQSHISIPISQIYADQALSAIAGVFGFSKLNRKTTVGVDRLIEPAALPDASKREAQSLVLSNKVINYLNHHCIYKDREFAPFELESPDPVPDMPYAPNKFLYRGMRLNTASLQNILSHGMEISKTRHGVIMFGFHAQHPISRAFNPAWFMTDPHEDYLPVVFQINQELLVPSYVDEEFVETKEDLPATAILKVFVFDRDRKAAINLIPLLKPYESAALPNENADEATRISQPSEVAVPSEFATKYAGRLFTSPEDFINTLMGWVRDTNNRELSKYFNPRGGLIPGWRVRIEYFDRSQFLEEWFTASYKIFKKDLRRTRVDDPQVKRFRLKKRDRITLVQVRSSATPLGPTPDLDKHFFARGSRLPGGLGFNSQKDFKHYHEGSPDDTTSNKALNLSFQITSGISLLPDDWRPWLADHGILSWPAGKRYKTAVMELKFENGPGYDRVFVRPSPAWAQDYPELALREALPEPGKPPPGMIGQVIVRAYALSNGQRMLRIDEVQQSDSYRRLSQGQRRQLDRWREIAVLIVAEAAHAKGFTVFAMGSEKVKALYKNRHNAPLSERELLQNYFEPYQNNAWAPAVGTFHTAGSLSQVLNGFLYQPHTATPVTGLASVSPSDRTKHFFARGFRLPGGLDFSSPRDYKHYREGFPGYENSVAPAGEKWFTPQWNTYLYQALAKLSHPALPSMRFNTTTGAWETLWLEGPRLNLWIHSMAGASDKEFLDALLPKILLIAEGVLVLNNAGILHGDIHVNNIVLHGPGEIPTLIDFDDGGYSDHWATIELLRDSLMERLNVERVLTRVQKEEAFRRLQEAGTSRFDSELMHLVEPGNLSAEEFISQLKTYINMRSVTSPGKSALPFNTNEHDMFGFFRDMGPKLYYVFFHPMGLVQEILHWVSRLQQRAPDALQSKAFLRAA